MTNPKKPAANALETVTVVKDARSVPKVDSTTWLRNKTRQNVYLAMLLIFSVLIIICALILLKKGGTHNVIAMLVSAGAVAVSWKKYQDELAVYRQLTKKMTKRAKKEMIVLKDKATVRQEKK